jgi:hypothetical protein
MSKLAAVLGCVDSIAPHGSPAISALIRFGGWGPFRWARSCTRQWRQRAPSAKLRLMRNQGCDIDETMTNRPLIVEPVITPAFTQESRSARTASPIFRRSPTSRSPRIDQDRCGIRGLPRIPGRWLSKPVEALGSLKVRRLWLGPGVHLRGGLGPCQSILDSDQLTGGR